jgi:hypothetical protein
MKARKTSLPDVDPYVGRRPGLCGRPNQASDKRHIERDFFITSASRAGTACKGGNS